jgi:hypothetical protein
VRNYGAQTVAQTEGSQMSGRAPRQFRQALLIVAGFGQSIAHAAASKPGQAAKRAQNDVQSRWQVPALQVPQDAQALPQAPQFAFEFCVFAQLGVGDIGEQSVCPAAHIGRVTPQVPALHDWPVAQALPQTPQFAAEICVSTHAPAQRTCAIGHATQATAPGMARRTVVPSPTCPSSLPPQQRTLRSARRTQVWSQPVVSSTTPVTPRAATGVGRLVIVLSPS